jgi:hypothetical protein
MHLVSGTGPVIWTRPAEAVRTDSLASEGPCAAAEPACQLVSSVPSTV